MVTDPEIPYCTRESVQAMLQSADNPRRNQRIDHAILQASRDLEGLVHRRFYPWTGTRLFDQPDGPILFLDDWEIATSSDLTIVSGDDEMASTDFILRPHSGPPYLWIEQNNAGRIGWQSGQTWQNAISITGTFHHPVRRTAAGATTDQLTSGAGVFTLGPSASIGVGSLLLLGTERMLVTEKSYTITGAELAADVPAGKGATVLTLDTPDAVEPGEQLMIGGERMIAEVVSGTTVVVTRGAAGGVLAAHTSGDAVLAPRQAQLHRGILGTTAAAHDAGTQIYLLQAPSLVQEAVTALAVTAVEQGSSAYARVVGSTDNQREAGGRGAAALLERVYARYGRKVRTRAV